MMTRPLRIAALGVALLLAAFVLRAGLVSVVLVVLGASLALGGLAIAALRLFPGYRRTLDESEELAAQKRSIADEHASAGATMRRSLVRGEVISGECAGVRYEHYIVPGGKSGPPRPTVSVPTGAPGEFQIVPESGATATVKTLGMVKEFQSGDRRLDANLYFSGSSDEYVRAVFAVPENLAVLRTLVGLGFDHLEKTAGRLIVSRPGGSYLDVEQVRALIELVLRLRLPMTVPGVEGKRLYGKERLYIVRAAVALLLAAGFLGLLTARPLIGGWTGFVAAKLPLVAALTLTAVAAAYFLLRGRSMSVRGFVELLLFLPFVVFGLFGTLALANEHLDAGEAEEAQAELVRYWSVRSKGTSYHLEFAAWRGTGTVQLTVGENVYALARDGQIWKLRVRPGLLGAAWVEEMAPTGATRRTP